MVTDHILVDLIMGAMSQAIPKKVMADSCGTLYDFCTAINLETHPRREKVSHRQYWGEIAPGGLGARYGKDGLSIMACHVTNCPIPPIEAQEIEAPMLFLERSIFPDSAGPGKYTGEDLFRKENGKYLEKKRSSFIHHRNLKYRHKGYLKANQGNVVNG